MKAATILIALFASMASASLRNVQCNGKPPSGWGSPNCNDADKTACKNLCTNGTIKRLALYFFFFFFFPVVLDLT
ncbi:hypothetical protein ColKHC_11372 [Colletotrichum higginsianum]|nr:hypothetical protein ColKHC_11372 [Colletotrichum higginsianum]